jgi:hypothetical protein
MKRTRAAASCVLISSLFAAALVSRAHAQPAAPVEAQRAAPSISPALAALIEAREGGEGPAVSTELRDYLLALPSHTLQTVERAVADEQITTSLHLGRILSLSLPPAAVDMVMGDNCFLCHTDPESHTGATLMGDPSAEPEAEAHMNLGRYVADVHFRRGIG